jgi:tRNA (guanine37-N1)-methyltransferase
MSGLIFNIITIFPNFFSGPFSCGIINQAQKKNRVIINIHNLRDFAEDRHKTIDDRPFGGGEGMVFKPEPLFRAVQHIYESQPGTKTNIILLSAQGQKFSQAIAFELSRCEQLTLICGRYEGVDERVTQFLSNKEISIGDYVLSGGELAACVLVDSVTRLLPGVLHNHISIVNESFSGGKFLDDINEVNENQSYTILDYPQYTRPENFGGLKVPQVLLSGNHASINLWRRKKALEKTLKNRPDLLQYDRLSDEDKQLLHMELEP